mmetsp:Transcript_70182/g.158720  ORF Transcript_70182/g.158720 Transcript_70182/m.158720 type:complete len:218 (+) Transcript_70182:96-749(+)
MQPATSTTRRRSAAALPYPSRNPSSRGSACSAAGLEGDAMRRPRSGTKDTRVKPLAQSRPSTTMPSAELPAFMEALGAPKRSAAGAMDGVPASAMLSRQVCVKTSFLAASYVSTVNSLLRMLVSLAPYPCLPPVRRTVSSSKLEPVSRCPKTISGTHMPSVGCRSTGRPWPLFVMVTLGSMGSIDTAMPFIAPPRTRLSAAFTRTSSKIFTSAGENA